MSVLLYLHMVESCYVQVYTQDYLMWNMLTDLMGIW